MEKSIINTDEEWTTREKLVLAIAAFELGVGDWTKISFLVKNSMEENLIKDKYSDTNCRNIFNLLYKTAGLKNFKETIGIILSLINERKKELLTNLKSNKEQHDKTLNEIRDLENGVLDDRLDEIYKDDLESYDEKTELPDNEEEYRTLSTEEVDKGLKEGTLNSHLNYVRVITKAKDITTLMTLDKGKLSEKITTPTKNIISAKTLGSNTGVSPELSNLVKTAIAGTTEDIKQQGNIVPTSSPTLSMLLEMPPRGPGQPLPEIPKLIKTTAAAAVTTTTFTTIKPIEAVKSETPIVTRRHSTRIRPNIETLASADKETPTKELEKSTNIKEIQKTKENIEVIKPEECVKVELQTPEITIDSKTSIKLDEEAKKEIITKTNEPLKSNELPISNKAKEPSEDNKLLASLVETDSFKVVIKDTLIKQTEQQKEESTPKKVKVDKNEIESTEGMDTTESITKDKTKKSVSQPPSPPKDTPKIEAEENIVVEEQKTKKTEEPLSIVKEVLTTNEADKQDSISTIDYKNPPKRVYSYPGKSSSRSRILSEIKSPMLEEVKEEEDEQRPSKRPKLVTSPPMKKIPTPIIKSVPKTDSKSEDETKDGEEKRITRSQKSQMKYTHPNSKSSEAESKEETPRTSRIKPPEHHHSFHILDSNPSSPASSTTASITLEDEKEIKVFKKQITMYLNQIAAHKNASLFLKPITDDAVQGYSNVVRNPMDLFTLKKNIEHGHIKSIQKFEKDLYLMFLNATIYNHKNNQILRMTKEMWKDSVQIIKTYKDSFVESKEKEREWNHSLRGGRKESSSFSELAKTPHDSEAEGDDDKKLKFRKSSKRSSTRTSERPSSNEQYNVKRRTRQNYSSSPARNDKIKRLSPDITHR